MMLSRRHNLLCWSFGRGLLCWSLVWALLALSARPDSGEPFFTGAFADDYDDQDTLATSLYEQQQWEQAARAWGELLERYPNDPRAIDASFFRGEALLQLGQLAAALEQFETAEQRWPASRHAAQLAFRIGESEEIVAETGLYNLTQDEAPLLVHFGTDRVENYLLVRMEQPEEEGSSSPQE